MFLVIQKAAHRGRDLVKQILAFSRLNEKDQWVPAQDGR